tara:strand:+ start:3385 stop:4098 length:714 start_codon:yes stop_codon:yes gene_type:complete
VRSFGIEDARDLANFEQIVRSRGARIFDDPTLTSAIGRIVIGDRNNAVIRVADALPPPRRRFTIAHELGHFELHAKQTNLVLCSDSDVGSVISSRAIENEANVFASNVLMPHFMFKKCLGTAAPTYQALKECQRFFQVSFEAAALRALEVCREPLYLLKFVEGSLVWGRQNNEWRKHNRKTLPRGMQPGSYSALHYAGVGSSYEEVDAEEYDLSADLELKDVLLRGGEYPLVMLTLA